MPFDADLNPVLGEFFALKADHFTPERAPVFHYMIWAHGYNGGTSSGRSMNIPHSDFIVTLGLWSSPGGTLDQQVGTFIHELGHNLGLMHGGGEHRGFKPNHLSVMNYSFQTRGVPFGAQQLFDYQRFPLTALSETDLLEEKGLGRSPALQGYRTIYNNPFDRLTEASAHASVDWDTDAAIDASPVAVDLNDDDLRTVLLATPNEWGQLIFNGGSIGSPQSLAGAAALAETTSAELPVEELTLEMLREIEEELQQ